MLSPSWIEVMGIWNGEESPPSQVWWSRSYSGLLPSRPVQLRTSPGHLNKLGMVVAPVLFGLVRSPPVQLRTSS